MSQSAPRYEWYLPSLPSSCTLETFAPYCASSPCDQRERVRLFSTNKGRAFLEYSPTNGESLGPDLALGPPDPARLAERLRTAHERSPRIDDILLDQQICSGIGNVYKSEILFIGQISPDRAVETLSEEKVRELFEVGSRLLRDNLEGGPRVTTASGHLKLNPHGSNLWVYGRRNQPCFRCQTPISRAITGRQTRVTYWCSQCQA